MSRIHQYRTLLLLLTNYLPTSASTIPQSIIPTPHLQNLTTSLQPRTPIHNQPITLIWAGPRIPDFDEECTSIIGGGFARHDDEEDKKCIGVRTYKMSCQREIFDEEDPNDPDDYPWFEAIEQEPFYCQAHEFCLTLSRGFAPVDIGFIPHKYPDTIGCYWIQGVSNALQMGKSGAADWMSIPLLIPVGAQAFYGRIDVHGDTKDATFEVSFSGGYVHSLLKKIGSKLFGRGAQKGEVKVASNEGSFHSYEFGFKLPDIKQPGYQIAAGLHIKTKHANTLWTEVTMGYSRAWKGN